MNLLEDLNNSLWNTKNVIYCYTNKINGKKYVGQTIMTLRKRHYAHMHDTTTEHRRGYNLHFHCSIRKYGIENFKLEILHVADKYSLDLLEIYYIEKWNLLNRKYGYNSRKGGNSGNPFINKTDEEMIEYKKNLSKRFSGENNPMYGKPCSDERKQHIKDSFTQEKRDKASKRVIGENNPMYGKLGGMHPESQKVKQYDLNGNLIKIWDSKSEAERFYNMPLGSISTCTSHKTNSSYGFIWRNIDDEFSYNDKRNKTVLKCDKNKNIIKEYETIKDASKDNKIKGTTISKCCKFWEIGCNKDEWLKTHKTIPQKVSGGFIWMYKKDYEKNIKSDIVYDRNENKKKIAQYDKQGNLIKIWDYAKQAGDELNINTMNIRNCCKWYECNNIEEWNKKYKYHPIKSVGGFIWKYYNENVK